MGQPSVYIHVYTRHKLRTSSLMPSTRVQPESTKGSLAESTAMTSTPLALKAATFLMYGGRWFTWHVGCVEKACVNTWAQGAIDKQSTYGEGTRDGEDDDLLALPRLGGELLGCRRAARQCDLRCAYMERHSRAPQARPLSSSGV